MEMSQGEVRKLIVKIERLLRYNQESQVVKLLEELDFHVIVQLIAISRSKVVLFNLLRPETQAKVLGNLSERVKKNIISYLDDASIKNILRYSDKTDIEGILDTVEEPKRELIEKPVGKSQEEKVKEMIQFLPESAGKLIDYNYILAPEDYMVADVARKIQQFLLHNNRIPVILVIDKFGHLTGRLYLALLINASAKVRVRDLKKPVLKVSHQVDQELLIHLIKKYKDDDLVVAVNEDDMPLGVIHAHQMLHIMQKEMTEDLYGFAGVHEEEEVNDSVVQKVIYRYRWLIINLFALLLAAGVISMFEDTISQIVLLAAYMPVIAGMGGNAATQALAVVVRGIALGEIEPGQGRKIVLKEGVAGILNGIITGALIAVIATIWHQAPILGLILAASMIINTFVAGLSGALIPIALRKIGIDPAVSSAVFLTTITDVVGFFVFLGLASVILLG